MYNMGKPTQVPAGPVMPSVPAGTLYDDIDGKGPPQSGVGAKNAVVSTYHSKTLPNQSGVVPGGVDGDVGGQKVTLGDEGEAKGPSQQITD